MGNTFTHIEFTTAGNARFAGGGRKGIRGRTSVCDYWRFKRSSRFARQMQNIPFSLGRTKPAAKHAAHTLSGRQSWHLILQVHRHSITGVLSSNIPA